MEEIAQDDVGPADSVRDDQCFGSLNAMQLSGKCIVNGGAYQIKCRENYRWCNQVPRVL